ncbi:Uncharacterized protein Fot_29601 [Forsythia ovata]|uniref:Uncharacterized protein n=1 Tax=Forsythia ovata TaxID=205694 RepID=A0ABD1TT57_9LAMI
MANTHQVWHKTKEMVCDEEAFEDCAQNCVLMHRKQKDPQPVARFFEVMIGEEYSKVMVLCVLASQFRCEVPDLVDHETRLEDSSGQLWPVTYSNIEGSLSFSQGMARVFTRCKQGGLRQVIHIRDSTSELGNFCTLTLLGLQHLLMDGKEFAGNSIRPKDLMICVNLKLKMSNSCAIAGRLDMAGVSNDDGGSVTMVTGIGKGNVTRCGACGTHVGVVC